uniref:Uncharacterized protein n=1 Tax=Scleropages formosus TaxID=113540 RepID=A0A8C9WHD9_SCLFO
MKSVALLCVFILSAASAMMVFRHPFRAHGSRCFQEQGMFYSDREFHDGYYIYKNLYIFPPGHYPRFNTQVYGHHYILADDDNTKGADGVHSKHSNGPDNASATKM